jgi:GT2 family glycosyltransferase
MSTVVPFVSVIIVNYNGAHYLPACLEALVHQSYRADRFEVIVSDNGSTDGSQKLITRKYNNIQLIDNNTNLGFAAGNNEALKIARGDYFVLLNNDTAPNPTWLENLVDVAERHPEAGLVTGRIRLFYDQLTLTLQSYTMAEVPQSQRQGLRVYGVETGLPGGTVQYLEGFLGWEHHPGQLPFRWSSGSAKIGVPVPPGSGEWEIIFSLAAEQDNPTPRKVNLSLGGTELAEWKVSGSALKKYTLHLPQEARSKVWPLLQNAGSIVFQNGAGRDRGTVVRNSEVFYDEDHGQFNAEEEVFAGCGANLLLRREMLDEVGLLDDDFFMYYEDTDLCWRARLKGWNVLYAPQAIIRHIHCGTSQEWSPAFVFYTDRNRLAMLFKNGTWSSIVREWGTYILKPIWNTCRIFRIVLLERKKPRASWGVLKNQCKVLFSLCCWLPRLGRDRCFIQHTRTVPNSAVHRWLERPGS